MLIFLNYNPKGYDPPVAEGPIYWMRKDDALTTQATTAGLRSPTKLSFMYNEINFENIIIIF